MGELSKFGQYYRITGCVFSGLTNDITLRCNKEIHNAVRGAVEKALLGMDEEIPRHVGEDNVTYQTSQGLFVLATDIRKAPTIGIFNERDAPEKEFAAGRLALTALRALLESVYKEQSYVTIHYMQGKQNRRISDLVEVNVLAWQGKMRESASAYAIPLHYSNRSRVQGCDLLIATLEQEAIESLRSRAPQGSLAVQTSTAKLWDAQHGILPGFFEKTMPYLGSRLYKRFTLPVAAHTDTSPQSDEALSPGTGSA